MSFTTWTTTPRLPSQPEYFVSHAIFMLIKSTDGSFKTYARLMDHKYWGKDRLAPRPETPRRSGAAIVKCFEKIWEHCDLEVSNSSSKSPHTLSADLQAHLRAMLSRNIRSPGRRRRLLRYLHSKMHPWSPGINTMYALNLNCYCVSTNGPGWWLKLISSAYLSSR